MRPATDQSVGLVSARTNPAVPCLQELKDMFRVAGNVTHADVAMVS